MLDKNGPIYTFDRFIVAPLLDVDLIATAYLQMKREGVLAMFYYEADPGLAKFLAIMTAAGLTALGCFVKRADGLTADLVGIGQVAVPIEMANGQKKAEIGVAFFKDWQRRSVTATLCRMMLEWTFDRTDIDYLFGTTPEKNPAMLRFLEYLGFGRTSEPIPHYATWHGVPCGVYPSWMSSETWKTLSPFR